jgi:hypothetical protein
MLVMANWSLARSSVDIALLVRVSAPTGFWRGVNRAHDISPDRAGHHPIGVTRGWLRADELRFPCDDVPA